MIINYCPHCMHNNEANRAVCSFCGKDMNAFNDPHQLPVNTILKGRYLLGRCIGQGGFGITYIGVNLESGERVAVKEFFPTGLVNRHSAHNLALTISQGDATLGFSQGKGKFINEARVLKMFDDQPNIVSVKEYFEDNSTAYIVMEYIDGKSLQELLNIKGRLSFEEAFSMLAPVMRGLGKVHEQGLIHRDISPSNIMMQRNGVMKLLDFGTARTMSQQGEHSLSIVLKPGFAPEEQYRSHGEQGPWTDVYALCATIYKLITGQTPENSLNRMFSDTLVRPSALGAVITPLQEQVLMMGMAVHHSQRIQNMPALYDAMCASLTPVQQQTNQTRQGEKTEGQTGRSSGGSSTRNETATGNKTRKPWLGALVTAGFVLVLALIIIKPGSGKEKEVPRESYGGTEIIQIEETPAESTERGPDIGMERALLHTIAAGEYHSVAVLEDGSVVVAGDNNFEQCEVEDWTDIISLTASVYTTVGLKADGTICISGPMWMEQGYDNFRDIIKIDDNSDCIVGLKADGTVVTNRNSYFDEVRSWKNIVDISAGLDHVAGIRSDGTVLVEIWDVDTDPNAEEAESWRDVIALSSGSYHLSGLKADGTVVTTDHEIWNTNPVENWRDIVQISSGCNFTVGLKADGTVVCTNNNYNISGWTDIVAVSASYRHILGLRSDGTVLASGDDGNNRLDVGGWSGVRLP